MDVEVLRLGHRYSRDDRMSTHIALTARAFGASKITYDVSDEKVKESVNKITNKWGGCFMVEFNRNWRKKMADFEGEKIHLTMYGLPINEVMPKLSRKADKLLVVGSQKVPKQAYELADYNVSVGSQPHSEVAALACFLDRLYGGAQFDFKFSDGLTIVPQKQGKKFEK